MWTMVLIPWILGRPAAAQEEICQPYGLPQWRAELGVAQRSLDTLEVDRARALLVEVERQLRCLEQVAEPADVALHARVSAQSAMFAMDPIAFEGWVRLARQLEPDAVWPLPEDHPLWRFLTQVTPGEPRGPEGVHPAHPRRGGIFLDGQYLERAVASAETPHLLQVFDAAGHRQLTTWIIGASFPASVLTETPEEATPPRWWSGAPQEAAETLDVSGWRAARIDTVDAYERYLEREPSGMFAAEARRRIDDHVWSGITEPISAEAADAYLTRFPDGRHTAQARTVLQQEALRTALADGSREALQRFLVTYPLGLAAAEARRRLDDLAWMEASHTDTVDGYARYRLQWPQGQHTREARLAQEQVAWELARAAHDPQALRDYLARWPAGAHVEAAEAALQARELRTVVIAVEAPEATPWGRDLARALTETAEDLGLDARTAPPRAPGDASLAETWELAPGEGLWRVVVTEHPQGELVRVQVVLEVHVRGFPGAVESHAVQHPVYTTTRTGDEADILGRYLTEALLR